ncbi:PREDICTED: RRP12-like protein [Rhagoletis zephyria]|uniref:RRP12-like protein n=1 Tax=Rhagoletis zephyria TaxID=28612 RepID=UPI00081177D2|nr:PREDICTED: RRP12-like protein [Rhagoletis zephyria]
MGKFRSKLKRHTKGKTWSKGQSSTSNPEQMRHRLKAKSRFFQPNLSLAPPEHAPNPNMLTFDAVLKHDQRLAYNAETTTVNDVAGSLKSFSLHDDGGLEDESMSESQQGTFKTFKTFASNYSACSNMSFKRLLVGFRASSDLHKEMLAILTALTEIIRERGGTESSTDYFILLMEQIEASTEDNDIIAGISLLSMGIKSVPAAVLRKRFGETAQTFLSCLQRFMESANQTIVKYIIGCLSVLLCAQEHITWTYSSTWQYIDAILSFTIHSKPKIRKAAQHAIVSIIHGSSFMRPTHEEEAEDADYVEQRRAKHHPASSRVTKFCLNQFKPEVLTNSQTTVLHTLTLLKDIVNGFKIEDIRSVCESLLSIMTAANVLIRTNCFQALHSLFASRTTNLNGSLCAKLLAAIHEYRPDRADVRQTVAWITVLKEGHIHLALLDLNLCMNALPRFFDICATDLWMSERTEIINSVSNCIKEILNECIKSACDTTEKAEVYRIPIMRIIATLEKVLNAPFGEIAKHVILIFSIVFEVCGKYFSKELTPSLQTLSKRYDTQSTLRVQIEHSIIAAIQSMGPEIILKTIPLTNSKGEVLLERSWLLPLLREGTKGASFKFFKEYILPLALDCNNKWHKYAQEKQQSMSHTYELLCCQLWGLFPGFCRDPADAENLRLIAPTLGNALDNNPEFRAPIFDGLTELIGNEENVEIKEALAKYSKNFLPRLFNIYAQKPNGTYEADLRKKALEVIKLYLTRTSEDVLKELFETAKTQLSNTAVGTFEYDAIFDINAALLLFQTSEVIRVFFETFIVPVLKNEKSKLVSKDDQKLKKQQRRTYELLRDILTSEAASCQKFGRKNSIALQKLLLDAFVTSCAVCQAARLRCLKILIENRKSLTVNDKIVMKTIPEAVISYKEFSTRKENVSEELIIFLANLYQEAGKLNDFVDILTAGFAGDDSLITNTILAFRAVVQNQGKNLTITTLEFIMEQILVFLVQKARSEAEAAVAFLITFIKVMPSPFVANHLDTIMKSLSAMSKDTKRYCRIQIGYLLKKLCKRFTAEELIKFVPGDDEVTHRRLKKIRKQMRRENRKQLNEKDKTDDDDSENEFVAGLEKKSTTIDDILADSDSDLPEDMDADNGDHNKAEKRKPKRNSTYIREDPEDIVDLADIKSIGNVLTNRPDEAASAAGSTKSKNRDPNRGFKTAEDGRLIISDKALRGAGGDDNSSSSGESGDDDDDAIEAKRAPKRGMEVDSSDEEELSATSRKRKATDAISMRSGKTSASKYVAGGKGIHRPLGAAGSDAISMKSGYSAKSAKSGKSTAASAYAGSEYTTKKAKGDMKKKGKLDPFAYIPLSRNTLNKRKRAKHSGTFKNIVNGARKGALRGVKQRVAKPKKQ